MNEIVQLQLIYIGKKVDVATYGPLAGSGLSCKKFFTTMSFKYKKYMQNQKN